MRNLMSLAALAVTLFTTASAQAPAANVLATVEIPLAVLAGGEPLAPGTYELRLTGERPAPLVGQAPDAREWVELAAGGMVVARELAEILRDSALPEAGASSRPVPTGVRVDLLQGGEFLRVSVKRDDGTRYLLHFPVPGAEPA
jgi:hypothetical protein